MSRELTAFRSIDGKLHDNKKKSISQDFEYLRERLEKFIKNGYKDPFLYRNFNPNNFYQPVENFNYDFNFKNFKEFVNHHLDDLEEEYLNFQNEKEV